jgi:hypothetical protein
MDDTTRNQQPNTTSGSRRALLFKSFALLLWVELVVAAYYIIHKPWKSGQSLQPLVAVMDILFALALLALAGGVGRRMLGELDGCSPLERVALHAAAGLGAMAFFVLALGLGGLLTPWLMWGVLGVGLLVFKAQIRGWFRDWYAEFEGHSELDAKSKIAVWTVGLLLMLGLLQAMATPLKWDSLVYHLELPKRYLQAGGVIFLDDNLFVGQPQLAEMLYTWAMALRSGETAAVLGWGVGVIALAGIAGFAKRLVSPRAFWIAPAVLLAGASISRGTSWAYVDLWVMLYGLATTIALDVYRDSSARKWLVLAGIMGGLALGAKYTAFSILVAGFCMLLVRPLRAIFRSRRRDQNTEEQAGAIRAAIKLLIRETALFGGVAVLVFSPWLLKNLVMTGNPVYPFFFMGKGIDEYRQMFYARTLPARSFFDGLIIPIQATILGIEGGPTFNTSIGPLLLAFIPASFLGWRSLPRARRVQYTRLLAMMLPIWPLWAIGAKVAAPLARTRHYYGIFPAFALLAALGIESASRIRLPRLRVGWVMNGLVILVLILTVVGEGLNFAYVDPLRVLAGVQSQEDYLAEQLGWYGPAMEAVNTLPADSRVAFLWEPRTYYCHVYCHPDVILDRWWYLMRTIGEPSAIHSHFLSKGFTHVMIYDLGAQFERRAQALFEPGDWIALAQFRETELVLIERFGEAYSLYDLKSLP